MKIPVVIGESVKLPLNPRQPTLWRLLRRKGHWHSAGTLPPAQAGQQQQLLHLYNETSHSHSKNKGHCYRVNKMHTLVIYCGCVVVFDWKFLCPWCSTKTNDMKKGSTLMCVRALCLVVMVSVDLNCLLWVNHCFHFLFFQGFCFWGQHWLTSPRTTTKNLTYKALECQLCEPDQTLIAP